MTQALLFDRVQRMLQLDPSKRQEVDLLAIMSWLKELSKKEAKMGKVSVLGELDDDVLKELVKWSVLETFSAGQLLIKQGNSGDRMFIILEGVVEVRVKNTDEEMMNTKRGNKIIEEGDIIPGGHKELTETLGIVVGKCPAGAVIGEVALVKHVVRTANVVCPESCSVITIDKDLFTRTLQTNLARLEQEREEFTNGFHLVNNWAPRFRQQFIRALMKERYFYGETIVNQGDKVNDVYFIVSGEVILYITPSHYKQQYELHLKAKEVDIFEKDAKKPKIRKTKDKENNGVGTVEWCCVSKNEMIGDLEVLCNLPTRMYSATVNAETVVFKMNLPEFRRLIIKEGRESSKKIRSLSRARLLSRNRIRSKIMKQNLLTKSEIPFVNYLIDALSK